jgi:hypothetical protein
MSRWRTYLRPVLLAVSVVVLNALIGIHRWLPDPRLLLILAPTVETAVVVAILLATAMMTARQARWIHWPLAMVVTLLVLFGVGEGFYQTIFRKGFVPWTDLGFLPALLNMVLGSDAFDSPLLAALPVAAIAALVMVALYLLIRWMDSLIRSGSLIPTAGVVLGLLALAVPIMLSGFRMPLTVRAAAQVVPPTSGLQTAADSVFVAQAESPDPDGQYFFAGLKDRDIHLLIVESYGHTLLTSKSHRPLIQPVYQRLEDKFRSAGYWVYSGFLTSPAFGGRSWLADSTLLTGTFIDSQHDYDEAVKAASPNLTHILGEAGYHRVLAAPGTYETDEAWRLFYDFDDYLLRYDFDYAGPFISFGAMPDQYLMHRTYQRVADINAPVFVNYVLVSSHVPFDQLPQYVEDWDTLGDGSIFNDLDLRLFDNNWLSGGEYPQGYVASIEYTLTAATAYITEIVADQSLFIIVGDHQPRIPISEPGSTFSVPFHVISQDHELVSEFSNFGLTPGLDPKQELPHPNMDEFLSMLLAVAHDRADLYAATTDQITRSSAD